MSHIVGAYRTVGGALVEVRSDYEERETEAYCTGFGCPASERFSWTYISGPLSDGTYVQAAPNPQIAHHAACKWAQEHAERCRAVPREEVQS